MKTRIRTAAILLPVLMLVIWVLPKIVAAVLVGAMGAIAGYELLVSAGYVRHKRLMIYCAVAAFGVALWSHFGAEQVWGTLGLMVFVGVLFVEMMCNHVKVRFEKLCICLMAGIVVPYLLSALVRILGTYTGRYTIAIPFLMAFLSDSGAYFAGKYLGRHKLAPVVSPNKTIEGVLGGLAAAVVGMLIYGLIMQLAMDYRVNYALAILYGFAGCLAGVFGDLCFSIIKRQTGIKDYGNLIPGHGGILDRLDSMVLVAPLTEALLLLLPLAEEVW
jgi:phosphatidate cytidylyltransferase